MITKTAENLSEQILSRMRTANEDAANAAVRFADSMDPEDRAAYQMHKAVANTWSNAHTIIFKGLQDVAIEAREGVRDLTPEQIEDACSGVFQVDFGDKYEAYDNAIADRILKAAGVRKEPAC